MEASFVSRAKTAIHSAASKAEKVFTDIKKSDSITHQDLDNRSPSSSTPETPNSSYESQVKDSCKVKKKGVRPKPIKTKQDWHERLRNLTIGKRDAEDDKFNAPTGEYAIFDDNLYMMGEREYCNSKSMEEGVMTEDSQIIHTDIIPSSAILKQLAIAVESGFHYNSMKDMLASSRGSSPVRERASLSISAMKSLVLREKEDKLAREFGSDERVLSVVQALINPEGHCTWRTLSCLEAQTNGTSVLKDIHGAPVESFVVRLSEALGCLKTLRKTASYWSRVVAEVKRLWYEGQHIPGIPPDEIPDLNSCLLYQQLQVINRCISRKRRHTAAVESVEFVTVQSSLNAKGSSASECTDALDPSFYARTKSGEITVRLGADRECDNLTMLETGEPIYSPVMQEPPLLTEDLIKETEEFVLRTGSVGAGCSQLLSDMQAFKAANPGCILEDFVRWHSPPDWMENDSISDLNGTSNTGDLSSAKGQLSMRMQKEGNLWRELWETSKPVPAVRQSPLYDEDLAVEGILDFLENISPSDLFKQLFLVALGTGLVIAEAAISTNSSLLKSFDECKNYIIVTCQGNVWVEKLDDICQVYETIEKMLLNENEVVKTPVVQSEGSSDSGELRTRFKKLGSIFGGKNKSSPKDFSSKDSKNIEESPTFSIFSKKPPKPSPTPSDKPSTLGDLEWTIV